PGGGGFFLSREFHRDRFAGLGPAPDRDLLVPLQDHAVPDDRRDLHVGERRRRGREEREKSGECFHGGLLIGGSCYLTNPGNSRFCVTFLFPPPWVGRESLEGIDMRTFL